MDWLRSQMFFDEALCADGRHSLNADGGADARW